MTEWYWPRYAVKVEVVEIMGTGKCPGRLKVGDSWVWKVRIPEGMCPWLANAIFPFFQALTFGGNIAWEMEEGATRVCCIDPRSPVVVKLERADPMVEPRTPK
jgi:uncharacterized repeat protein (TIGR04076 family)